MRPPLTQRAPPGLRDGALLVLLALVATFPAVLTPLSRLVGSPDVDVWNHAWGAWWFWTSLSQGDLPFHTALLGAPAGGTLWYIDPVGALASAALVPILGVVGAWNTLVIGYVTLVGWGARRLSLALGASAGSSWIAAIAAGFSPFLLSEVHNGISEAMGGGLALGSLALGMEAFDQGGRGRWVRLGGAMALTTIGSWYYGLSAALVLLTWALSRRHGWRGLLLAAAVGGALYLPVAWVIRASVHAPDALIERKSDDPTGIEGLLTHNALDPRSFLWPGDLPSVDLSSDGEDFRHTSYLGWAALLLAVRSRRWGVLASAAVPAIFSLGPYLWFDGGWVTAGGSRVVLPYFALLHLLPAAAVTHAQRLGWCAIGLVAALAGVGARTAFSRPGGLPATPSPIPLATLAGLAMAVALDALALGPAPWPLARAPELDTAVHRALPGTGTVLDLPVEVGQSMAASRYLVYQAAGGHSIPYGPNPHPESCGLSGSTLFLALALPSLRASPHAAGLRAQVASGGMVDLSELAREGVEWVVLHMELERGQEGTEAITEMLRRWYGEPSSSGTHRVWDVTHAGGRMVPLDARRE